ncbi:hypothetical protein BDZ94DRAFT_1158916 [Collybia nuda]|uniref:Acetyl-CoA synthetase-like protein n=1 Tax=Collybia nuda TaxID=64659 RepID=A0A9P5YDL8_9AGAR|nr:hypothetical protein BDZ94DRAFT_1158916 [Collybia nuda]
MEAPAFVTPQAVTSTTFQPPSLHENSTISEIYDFHLHENGNHPLFVYDGNGGEIHTICWRRAVQAIYKAGTLVRTLIGALDESKAPTIAILAVIDQLSYFALTAGIIRAGYRAFPISPRNSAAGVASLLQKMAVKYIFVSGDQAMRELAAAACAVDNNTEENVAEVRFLEAPLFETLFGKCMESSDAAFQQLPPARKRNVDDVAMVLHSSGSTSFPKPILITHRNLLQWGSQPYYGETDVCGRILSNHTLPFFHAMGVVSISWATMVGITLSNFAPSNPPIIPTPDRVYSSAIATKSRLIFCVPAFLEEWSQDAKKVDALRKFDAILFGGGPIQKVVGDELVEKGVCLYPFYGATEIGGTSKFLAKRLPKEGWEYFQISPHTDPIFQEQETENTFRLLFRNTFSHTLTVTNTQMSGIDMYDTNDLLIRHRSNAKLWKIYGRSDDQIMHSTGEKTNPVPMETIMNRHPAIFCTIIFGRGRFQAGVLVEPNIGYKFDPNDLERLAEFRNLIWSSIEEANKFGPSHSRIFKELVLVANHSKPFQYTAKGTPRRQIILNDYEQEIRQGYDSIEESSQPDILLPRLFTFDTCLDFTLSVVKKVMGRAPTIDEDIFQNGCDSLQATWIRNTILHTLRQTTKCSIKDIPINFVYLHPTVNRLSQYLARITQGGVLSPDIEEERAVTAREMQGLVEKYTYGFPQRQTVLCPNPTSEVVFLTGSTGGLGCYLLERLVLTPSILRIYAFNRKANTASYERQREAFKDRGIDVSIINSQKITFLEGDTSQDKLGLHPSLYEEVRTTITCIIHNAWHVDFNIVISSMEPLIVGTRRLVDLALSSPYMFPPRILFTSSIGAVRSRFHFFFTETQPILMAIDIDWTQNFAPETSITYPDVAIGSGYPESKWVAERVLTLARERTAVSPIIVRIGQLSGGRNGSWNPFEWVPSIVRSGQVLGCLPHAPGVVSWIPVSTAAACLVEMRRSEEFVLHLAHPNPVSWCEIFGPISEVLGVRLVPYPTWLSALEASLNDSARSGPRNTFNPASRLLDFFQSANKPLSFTDAEAFGFPRLCTENAVKAAPSLENGKLCPLGKLDVERWLKYWTDVGHLCFV